MRFKKRIRAVLLSAATLASGNILAAEPSHDAPALSDSKNQVQPATRDPDKPVKKNHSVHQGRKKKAGDATGAEGKSPLPGQGKTDAPPAPAPEKSQPSDNDTQPLERKGVRG
jgi:hypothetical protein